MEGCTPRDVRGGELRAGEAGSLPSTALPELVRTLSLLARALNTPRGSRLRGGLGSRLPRSGIARAGLPRSPASSRSSARRAPASGCGWHGCSIVAQWAAPCPALAAACASPGMPCGGGATIEPPATRGAHSSCGASCGNKARLSDEPARLGGTSHATAAKGTFKRNPSSSHSRKLPTHSAPAAPEGTRAADASPRLAAAYATAPAAPASAVPQTGPRAARPIPPPTIAAPAPIEAAGRRPVAASTAEAARRTSRTARRCSLHSVPSCTRRASWEVADTHARRAESRPARR
eukprot:scaffold14018_cov118-Isochrysis_galbana.AAC.6